MSSPSEKRHSRIHKRTQNQRNADFLKGYWLWKSERYPELSALKAPDILFFGGKKDLVEKHNHQWIEGFKNQKPY